MMHTENAVTPEASGRVKLNYDEAQYNFSKSCHKLIHISPLSFQKAL